MSHFYQQLAMLVGHWRSSGYPSNFPAIAEILATGNSIARDRASTAYQFVTEP